MAERRDARVGKMGVEPGFPLLTTATSGLTTLTWVWVSSGSWWWTGRPGVLQSTGSRRVRHDWVTELNWTELTLTFHLLLWVEGINTLGRERDEVEGRKCLVNSKLPSHCLLLLISKNTMKSDRRGMQGLLWEATGDVLCQKVTMSLSLHHSPTSFLILIYMA